MAKNQIAEILEDALGHDRQPKTTGFLGGLYQKYKDRQFAKAIGDRFLDAAKTQMVAATQGAVVNATAEAVGAYDRAENIQHVPDKTSITFGMLRASAAHMEPATACIGHITRTACAYANRPDKQYGRNKTPGFEIVLSDPNAEPTEEDLEEIDLLTGFIENCGYPGAEPPIQERPIGWKPGFEMFTKMFLRDSYTMDWCAARMWASAIDPDNEPIVCFAAVDAGLIRYWRDDVVEVVNGVPKVVNEDYQRTNNKGPIRLVKVSSAQKGGVVVHEYTAKEVAVGVRNPRSDEEQNGYGYAELEQAINCVSGWIFARDDNLNRYTKNALPPGFMVINGKQDEQQMAGFRRRWKEMVQGFAKRWDIPILFVDPEKGGAASYINMNPSPRDMEYHMLMFCLSVWFHAILGMHPEESGFDATSPMRAPMQEASPEQKIEFSQSSWLGPLLRWYAEWLNNNIIYRMRPSKRYKLKFVGTGEYDELQEEQLIAMKLQNGTVNLRMVWKERNQPIPEILKDSDVWDIPAPFMVAMQYLDAQMQQAQQQQMMQQQQQAAAMQQAQGDGQVPGGQPPGMPPMQPGAPQQAQQTNMQPVPPMDYMKAYNEAHALTMDMLSKSIAGRKVKVKHWPGSDD